MGKAQLRRTMGSTAEERKARQAESQVNRLACGERGCWISVFG
jgi:hypothetical protein